ncbi:MAG: hypothetical protein WAU00_05470 [Caldilinea sp.]
MKEKINLKRLLTEPEQTHAKQIELFALLNLGMLEAVSQGLMSTSEAVQTFFYVENCLFVRQQMRNRTADEIMSRGVALPDLFDVLPPHLAQREFRRELSKMHALCLALLELEAAVA